MKSIIAAVFALFLCSSSFAQTQTALPSDSVTVVPSPNCLYWLQNKGYQSDACAFSMKHVTITANGVTLPPLAVTVTAVKPGFNCPQGSDAQVVATDPVTGEVIYWQIWQCQMAGSRYGNHFWWTPTGEGTLTTQ
jgi:hypothetical protein